MGNKSGKTKQSRPDLAEAFARTSSVTVSNESLPSYFPPRTAPIDGGARPSHYYNAPPGGRRSIPATPDNANVKISSDPRILRSNSQGHGAGQKQKDEANAIYRRNGTNGADENGANRRQVKSMPPVTRENGHPTAEEDKKRKLFDYPELYDQKIPPISDLPLSIVGEASTTGRRTSSRRKTAPPLSQTVPAVVLFPASQDIKRKLMLFATHFMQSLADKYATLSYQQQLSGLSVALCINERSCDVVTLWNYVTGTTDASLPVPVNLSAAKSDSLYYMATIPEALLLCLIEARSRQIEDESCWTVYAQDILACVAAETAAELSRMFEYQIAVACDDKTVHLMAEFAADCILGAASETPLDRNVALFAVVTGTSNQKYTVPEEVLSKQLSALVGQQEFKWRLRDIFRKPGLRRESMLTSTGGLEVADVPNFRFYASTNIHDPSIYGFRGEFIEWDFIYCCYKLHAGEATNFPEELSPTIHNDDIHRSYRPFNRLVGGDAMKYYCRQTMSGKYPLGTSLASLVGDKHADERDELRVVYRPVQGLQEATRGKLINFSSTVLDEADLIRCRIRRADWSQFSAKQALMLWCEMKIDDTKKCRLQGADVSYGRLITDGETTLPRDITAVYVTLGGSSRKSGTVDEQTGEQTSKGVKAITNDKQQIISPIKAVEEKFKEVEEEKKRNEENARKSLEMEEKKEKKAKKKKRKSSSAKETGESAANDSIDKQASAGQAEYKEQYNNVLDVSAMPVETTLDTYDENLADAADGSIAKVKDAPILRQKKAKSEEPKKSKRKSKKADVSFQEEPVAIEIKNPEDPSAVESSAFIERVVTPEAATVNLLAYEEQPIEMQKAKETVQSLDKEPSRRRTDNSGSSASKEPQILEKEPTRRQFENSKSKDAEMSEKGPSLKQVEITSPVSKDVEQFEREPSRRKNSEASDARVFEKEPSRKQRDTSSPVSKDVLSFDKEQSRASLEISVPSSKDKSPYEKVPSKRNTDISSSVVKEIQIFEKEPSRSVETNSPLPEDVPSFERELSRRLSGASRSLTKDEPSFDKEPARKSVDSASQASKVGNQEADMKPVIKPSSDIPIKVEIELLKVKDDESNKENESKDSKMSKRNKAKRSSSDSKKKKRSSKANENTETGNLSPPISSVSAPNTPGGTRKTATLAVQEVLDSSMSTSGESRPTSPFSDIGVGTKTSKASSALPTSWMPLKIETSSGRSMAPVTPAQRALSATNVSAEATTPSKGRKGGALEMGSLTTWKSQQYQLARTPNDIINRSLMSARSFLSTAELENLRKSQVFAMTRDLQIKQTPSNLPMSLKPLFGRQADIDAVCSLLQQPQRIVVMTGCPGTGKASLALAVASRLVADQLVPFVIDARGAPTCEGVLRRLLQVFDVRFKLREMTYFCNWLNSQEQSPLIVINNVEIVQDEDTIFSDLLDRLVSGVKNARIICTSGRNFYSGKTPCQLYKVADLGSSTKRVVLSLAPDLHEEGVDELCKACDNVLLGVYLTAKSCTLPEVDPGQLFVDVTTFDNGIFEPAKVWDLAGMGASDEDTRRKLAKVMAVIERVILNLPQSHQTVLTTSSMFACYFDVSVCCHMSGLSEPEVKQVLKELVETGFVLTETHKNKPCYYVESFVKHVARAICFANRGDDALLKYCGYFVNQLKSLCSRFWSPSVSDVVNEFDENFDNFIDVIEHTIDRDNLLSQIAEASQIENIIFYATVLPDKLYLMMYDALAQVADTNNDVQTMADSFCALSYYYVETGKPERARSFALRAFELLQNAPAGVAEKLDKTLCWQSLGRALWHEVEEKTRALMLLKRAQEVTHATKGVRHLKTLIANEFYAALLTQTENFQMARHYYNISDMALRQLQEHPFFLPGFECRRIIWDKLNLFQRSTDMSLKSSTVTQRYHGDHPLTATAYTRYCDCLLRQGSIQEAIKACINALSIRTRVLGNHLDTAFSNKTLAYLLLKCGQPEESMRYCDTALEIYEKLRSDEALKMDVRNIIAQARSRHMAQLTAAARAELTNGYNSLDTSLPSSGGVSTTV